MRLDVIECGDAKRLTEAIPDASVHAVICDPVYWQREDYAWLGALAARVLVPGGAVLAQVGEPFLYDAWTAFRTGAERAAPGALVHLTPIIEVYHFATSGYRTGATNFSSGYAPWIFATRGPKRCSIMNRTYGKRDKTHHAWGDGAHFARTYLRALTQPGEIVLDPFAGGGTVPAAAISVGRHFYACEIDPARAAAANTRLLTAPRPLVIEGLEQDELPLAGEGAWRRE
jgi:hypothetical protein